MFRYFFQQRVHLVKLASNEFLVNGCVIQVGVPLFGGSRTALCNGRGQHGILLAGDSDQQDGRGQQYTLGCGACTGVVVGWKRTCCCGDGAGTRGPFGKAARVWIGLLQRRFLMWWLGSGGEYRSTTSSYCGGNNGVAQVVSGDHRSVVKQSTTVLCNLNLIPLF